MTDWEPIRTEYVTDKTASYRGLAAKYGVSRRSIEYRARREMWHDLRKAAEKAVAEKTIAVAAEAAEDRVRRIGDIVSALLIAVEERVQQGLIGSMSEVRQLTAALKDIKELSGIRYDLDDQEQRARIAKLQADAKRGTADTTQQVVVQIQGGEDSWAQ